MNKALTVLFLCLFLYKANAQSTPGPAERAITDSVCDCLSHVDLDKINNKQDAVDAISNCFGSRTDMLIKVAKEMNVDESDREAMRNVGITIGKDLLNQNCTAFIKLSVKMAESEPEQADGEESSTTGTFKRIELKGFNYIIITDSKGSERSFLWLQQFPGSERFMADAMKYAGKKFKIVWKEIEVYLPSAKGYYKVKEITAVEVF